MDAQILEQIIKLATERGKLAATIPPPVPDLYQSEQIDEIAGALAMAQGSFPKIFTNRTNPYWKTGYADEDVIMHAVRPFLAAHDLALFYQMKYHEGATMLHSRLLHKSGQWMESRSRLMPVKNDPYSMGSELQFSKVQAIKCLLGVTIADDPFDDDAERAMADHRNTSQKGTAINTKYNPRESKDTVTREQIEAMEYDLKQYPDIVEEIYRAYRINSLADLPKDKFQVSIERIRQITELRNGRPTG